jgi:hypothetical protein
MQIHTYEEAVLAITGSMPKAIITALVNRRGNEIMPKRIVVR